MPPPKPLRKHRTFDCHLVADMPQPERNRQPTTNVLANNDLPNDPRCQNHLFIHDDDDRNTQSQTVTKPHTQQTPPPNQPADSPIHSPQLLSKLVLSTSLHQLADSKYYNNHNQSQSNANKTSDRPQPSTKNQTHNMEHNNATMQRTTVPDVEQKLHHLRMAPNDNLLQPNTTNANHNPTNHNNNNTNKQFDAANPTTNNNSNNNHQSNDAKTIPTTQNAKQREANLDTVHVVVGNESCDLDSAVSCLLMFHIISKMSDEINGKDKTRTLYIPLLNTTRDMLDSKCEVLWFLQKTLNIDKSFLTCKDDIDWKEIKKNGVEVLVTLVDHNYNEEFKDIGKIVEIIDHHQVQNPQWLMQNQSQIRVTLDTSVGSCTTLVAERLFYIYAEHHVSDEILLLIYGTVLLDTICLSEKAKRFTRRDVYLLKKLDSLLGSKKPVRDELYKQLVEVKNSTRELNFEKLMKRDLKIYKDKHGMRVGIASLFGMAARETLGLAANIDLDLFFRQNQFEAFIIMGLIADLDHSDSISRDLVLISANSRLFGQLCRAFEQDTSKLDLQPIGSDSSPDPEDNIINNKRIIDSSSDLSKASTDANGLATTATEGTSQPPFYKARIWLQRNVTSSRKIVAPLVLKVLHDSTQ